MITLLAALALVPAAYQSQPWPSQTYLMKAEFNGFVPILGGNEGKVEVTMGVDVSGLPVKDGKPQASTEISRFGLKFNDAALPFGLESVQDFFPKATIGFTPQGKVTGNTTPNRALPVRLPGLDPRRLPELTFLPVELPADGLKEGGEWTFERTFSGAPMKYECRVDSLTPDQAVIAVKVSQEFEYLENEALEVIAKESDAVTKAKTSLLGAGRVWFNLKDSAADGVVMNNTTVTLASPLKGGPAKERKLSSSLEVTRGAFTFPFAKPDSPAKAPSAAAPKQGPPAFGFDLSKVDWRAMGCQAWQTGAAFWKQLSSSGFGMDQVISFLLSLVPIIGPLFGG